MKANKIKPEHVVELLENVELNIKCSICQVTYKELLKVAKKEMKKRWS